MKNFNPKYSLPMFFLCPFLAQGQIPVINFENSNTYKNISIYDTWEQSPFRTGKLSGNVAVVPNPDKKSVDPSTGTHLNNSKKVLGAQRSRFGSNTFGVRVDLPNSFELTPTKRYIHVKMLKPQAGRVMLVGLGSRKERLDQNPFTEQFWVLSSTPITPGSWSDAVFPIKGADGIDIRSLVIVPDCESPHNLAEDFLFYIDDIEINDSPSSRTQFDNTYIINGNKKTLCLNNNDNYTYSVALDSPKDGRQEIAIPQKTDKHLYFDNTQSILSACIGETVIPAIGFDGEKMNGYVYVDWNKDGVFTHDITDNVTPAYGSEIMAYSYIGGKNSRGEKKFDIYSMEIPGFKIPDNILPGNYRMRFKTDRDNNDPGGNIAASSRIQDIGGAIVDVTLNVHGETVEVNDFQLNGEILGPEHQKLNAFPHHYGQPLKIFLKPEKGFTQGGLTIRCGYDLKEENPIDELGNMRYRTLRVSPEEIDNDGAFVIPADFTRGNIYILGNMIENK